MAIRINILARGIATPEEVKENTKLSKGYPRVEWAVYEYPVCAVVGGGPSVKKRLDELKEFRGDIFAINDTAGYLSDNGISCYLYAIDVTKTPYRIGPLVKGAIFGSRVNQVQFKQFKREQIRVFDLVEEDQINGIEGGPTAACRTHHLFLKMGYKGVKYFGCEGSIVREATHITGYSEAAYNCMIIISAAGVEYLTNAAFMMQSEFLSNIIREHKRFFFDASGGLLRAMIENPETWEVVAVGDDLKERFPNNGEMWNKKYKGEFNSWQLRRQRQS